MTEHLRLISTPQGYECATDFGLFTTAQKWKEAARKELRDWLEECRAEELEPA